MLEDVANNLLMTIGPMRVMTMSANSVDNSESSDNTMMNGLARYLATQIYQNKLDREAVLNTYPDIKDDIESYLNNMEIIPVVTDEEQWTIPLLLYFLEIKILWYKNIKVIQFIVKEGKTGK